MKNKALGKGLSALLGENVLAAQHEEFVQLVDIDKIEPRGDQPRKQFDIDRLRELADSISNNGLLQPIIVSKSENGKYKIIAGERRWRASKLAKLHDMPVIIKDLSELEIIEIALIENIQREELSVIEESQSFERLIKEFGYTQEQLAQKLSKSRGHIGNLLRLNLLPQSIKNMLSEGSISMGHARCLINHVEAEKIAEYIVCNDLSVRQTEELLRNWSKNEYTKTPQKTEERLDRKFLKNDSKDNDLELLAKSLSERFNLKITIEDHKLGGKLIFQYNSMQELDSVLSRLS